MIRLSWRQFRTPAIVALLALVVAAVVAAVTGPSLAHAYAATMAACRATGDCASAMQGFARNDNALLSSFNTLVTVVPALLGAFWGAPLIAREIESRTFPLVWTQSVTRTRWLVVKLVVVGLSSMLVAGLLSLIVTWWARPLDQAAASAYVTFDSRDLVPIGYAAFAFALGVMAGMLIRRTVPAMAVTLFVFLVVRVTTTFAIRPRIITPTHLVQALDPASTGFGSEISPTILLNTLFNGGPSSALDPAPPNLSNVWIYSTRVVDGSGHDLTNAVLNATCPGVANGGGGTGGPTVPGHIPVSQDRAEQARTCITKIGTTFHELVTYQPATHYWALQWAELAIYSAAALLLGAFCVWWLRRHRIT
jgi:ABC-type transport system involved in multi-copper enzyme maturation permease subunit